MEINIDIYILPYKFPYAFFLSIVTLFCTKCRTVNINQWRNSMKQLIKKLFASRSSTQGVVLNAIAVTQGKPGFQSVDIPFVSKDSGLGA